MRVLVIVLAGQAMASMDGSILAVAAPELKRDLGASDAELQLIVTMYILTFAATVVTGARLGDVLGRRNAFIGGLAAFTVASLTAGLAPDAATLVVARAAQGLAAALMTPQVLSIIQTHFEGDRRDRAIGAYSLILAAGVAAGQVLGGLLIGAQLLDGAWRPALLVNVPVGAVLLVGAWRGLPAAQAGARRRIDYPGVAVLAVALLAFVIAMVFGRDAGWPLWVWPCLTASLLAFAAFVAVERRASDPIFDLAVLGLAGVATGVVAVILIMSAYAAFLLSLTLHLQDGLGFGPLRAGLVFSVYAAGFATASLTWTRIPSDVRIRLPVVGALVMAAGVGGVGLLADDRTWAAVAMPLLFAAGAGHAWGFSPLAASMTLAVKPAQSADLSGLLLTASLFGSVLGLSSITGVYIGAAPGGSAAALTELCMAVAAVLLVTAASASLTLAAARARLASVIGP